MYTAIFVTVDTNDWTTTSDTYTINSDYELQIRIDAWLKGNEVSKSIRYYVGVYKDNLECKLY